MKIYLQNLLKQSLTRLKETGALLVPISIEPKVDRARTKEHGDFTSNIALVAAGQANIKARDLAQKIVANVPASELVTRLEIAGPGFINFYLSASAFQRVVPEILRARADFGRSRLGQGQAVQVEFVSANPNGPLHVGHGRGAAYGAVVADLLATVGFQVQREYYINDAGRQMDILAVSVWFRYLELTGEAIAFPDNGYQGDYVYDIAAAVHREHGDRFRHPHHTITQDLPPDTAQGGDKDIYVDALIARAQKLLGAAAYRIIFDAGLTTILGDIRQDLKEFGITYDQWFSERSLTESGAVDRAIERLRANGHIYSQDGALWFRSSAFGDEKDRVVVRENGQKTYFASDIAYHLNKVERGFARVIDIWGADHHGYVPRIKAALAAAGHDPSQLDVLLVQFAILYRGSTRVQMSTRSGEFITLRELRREVGNDAARFFYVLRKCEQHMDFDLELAKSQSSDNPVYYVQYAHARICSVFGQLREKDLTHDESYGNTQLQRLNEPHELALLAGLARYPEVVEAAASAHEPHQLAHYLRELAHDFHTYYNTHIFLVEERALREVRLNLIAATRQVIANGLRILGVSAPETM